MEILVELVKAHDKGGQGLMLRSGHLAQELRSHHLCRDVLASGDLKPLRLRVYITDVDTALVVEQDLVVVTEREDADVELLTLIMRHHGLHDEVRELPGDCLHRLLLAHPVHDPRLPLIEALVQGDQARLAAALDQLVRLHDELLCLQPRVRIEDRLPRVTLGLIEHIRRDEDARITNGVLSPRNLREPLRKKGLARVLADRLHGHDPSSSDCGQDRSFLENP
mmetsp:Transcript_21680/g.48570  ORF Transcript_21680/g.48570 Transcript_21680/m.48570 type:complete len:223 (+) Transcript_21680:648-1316(+)